jgi:hypothetical protein
VRPAASNAFCRYGRSNVSYRADDVVSGSSTPMSPLPWPASPFSWFMAEKSTVKEDNVGAVVDAGAVVLLPEPVEVFDELPQALAASATPMATAIAADRFRETCMCFPL